MKCPKCGRELVEKYGRIPAYHASFIELKKESMTKTLKRKYYHCRVCAGNFVWTVCLVEFDLEKMKVLRAHL